MKNIVIQINSVQALERLIGGDTQVEIDVRNSVVQKFAESHLKSLANSSTIKLAVEAIQKEAVRELAQATQAAIGELRQNSWGGSYSVVLNDQTKEQINTQALKSVGQLVEKAVEESLAKWANPADLSALVKRKIDLRIANLVTEEIKKQLETLKQ